MFKKKQKRTLAAALMLSLSLSACSAGGSQTQSESTAATKEETAAAEQTLAETEPNAEPVSGANGIVTTSDALTFPLGMEVHSDTFTGAAYLSPMIENDDIYHFPQTNNVTFEAAGIPTAA